jgi:hypothetical protein
MTLKVIGAGFGRTGTDSMREALNILGLGPCHHMYEVIANETQKQRWRALAQGAAPDWPSLFEGYKSCVDWPSVHYWRELVEAYPQARVVLTWRSPESWWASFEKTIVAGIANSTDPQSLGIALIAKQVFGGRMHDRAHAISVYEAHVQAVREAVPKDRLLVHELGDGWAPLCAHLRVAVPPVDYPSRNNAEQFQSAFIGAANAKP